MYYGRSVCPFAIFNDAVFKNAINSSIVSLPDVFVFILFKLKSFGIASTINTAEDLHKLKRVSDILTTLCAERSCSGNCSIYRTPTSKCYNGHKLFPPNDNLTVERSSQETNPFGSNDILDEVFYGQKNIRPWHFKRSFYRSKDGSCSGGITDSFESLPFDECVGPFGPPFPWGKFELDAIELKLDSMPSLRPKRYD